MQTTGIILPEVDGGACQRLGRFGELFFQGQILVLYEVDIWGEDQGPMW